LRGFAAGSSIQCPPAPVPMEGGPGSRSSRTRRLRRHTSGSGSSGGSGTGSSAASAASDPRLSVGLLQVVGSGSSGSGDGTARPGAATGPSLVQETLGCPQPSQHHSSGRMLVATRRRSNPDALCGSPNKLRRNEDDESSAHTPAVSGGRRRSWPATPAPRMPVELTSPAGLTPPPLTPPPPTMDLASSSDAHRTKPAVAANASAEQPVCSSGSTTALSSSPGIAGRLAAVELGSTPVPSLLGHEALPGWSARIVTCLGTATHAMPFLALGRSTASRLFLDGLQLSDEYVQVADEVCHAATWLHCEEAMYWRLLRWSAFMDALTVNGLGEVGDGARHPALLALDSAVARATIARDLAAFVPC